MPALNHGFAQKVNVSIVKIRSQKWRVDDDAVTGSQIGLAGRANKISGDYSVSRSIGDGGFQFGFANRAVPRVK